MRAFNLPSFLLTSLLFLFNPAWSSSFSGAISAFDIPDGWQHQSDSNSGTHALIFQNDTQLIISWLPKGDPKQILSALQSELGWQNPIVSDPIAGKTSHRFEGTGNGYNASIRVTVLSDGFVLTILNTARALDDVRPTVANVLQSITIAPRAFPGDLLDSFRTRSDFSSSYSAELGNTAFTEVTTLLPNGLYVEGTNVSASSSSATAISRSDASGLWEVRGNLIYFMTETEYLSHFRFESFSNGLELYSESPDPWLWVRQ